MSEDERYDTVDRIANDPTIKVPAYMDSSPTSKVLYALGMINKPTVVSDEQLEQMGGQQLYRVVSDSMINGVKVPSADVLDQFRHGDYTRLSGDNDSLKGRALYFADDFTSARSYGQEGRNSMVMMAKIKPESNIVDYMKLNTQMKDDWSFRTNIMRGYKKEDATALYAITHGIDGWYDKDNGYTMIINRGALTVSSQSKKLFGADGKRVRSWEEAENA